MSNTLPMNANRASIASNEPNSTYEVEKLNESDHRLLGIESFSTEVNAWNPGVNVTVELKLSTAPGSVEELVQIVTNDYLKSRGIPDTIEEIISNKYPEHLI